MESQEFHHLVIPLSFALGSSLSPLWSLQARSH